MVVSALPENFLQKEMHHLQEKIHAECVAQCSLQTSCSITVSGSFLYPHRFMTDAHNHQVQEYLPKVFSTYTELP